MGRAVLLACLVVLAGCAGLGTDPGVSGSPDGAGPTLAAGAGTPVTVVDVVDGDTVDVRYENGTTDRVRLLGVDTPEVHTNNDPSEFEGVPATEAGASCLRRVGEAASVALRERIDGAGARVVVDGSADRRDRYGRLLAYLVDDGTDLNHWLVGSGYARVYDTTFARADRYYAAESTAQDAGRGVWGCRDPDDGTPATTGLVVASTNADATGNDHENRDDEYVVFENAGTAVLDLGGWTVSDAAGRTYTFPTGRTLDPGSRLTLVTGPGTDGTDRVYWGQDSAVWNNGGDTVTVRTGAGRTVLERSYD